jgi:hypothetical protein
MRARAVLVLVILAMVVLVAAPATRAGALPKGTLEVAAYALYDYSSYGYSGADDGSSSDFTLTGQLGYCVTDLIEVFGGLLVQHSSVDPVNVASTSSTAIGPEAGMMLNFANSSIVVPYISGAVGLVSYSGTAASYSTGWMVPFLGAGIRVLVGNSASFNLGVAYVHNINALGISDETSDSIRFSIGISAFPKKLASKSHSRH